MRTTLHRAAEGAAAGVVLAVLLTSNVFRFVLGLAMLYVFFVVGSYVWSGHEVNASTMEGQYRATINEGVRQSTSFEPYFQIDGTMENKSDKYMDGFYMMTTLLECPDENSVSADCTKVDEKSTYVNVHKAPGFLMRFSEYVMFDQNNTGADTRVYRTESRVYKLAVRANKPD